MSGDIGKFYKYVNQKKSHKSGVAPLKDPFGVLANTDLDKAELLNKSFINVGVVDNCSIPSFDSLISPISIDIVYFDSILILKCISKLNSKSSAGPDGFSPLLFKQLAHVLAEPLSMLFRLIMQYGEFPSEWKIANVTPIFKKGSSTDPLNYRPISITCVCSKLFECGIKLNILDLFNDYLHSSNTQHGFVASRSTCTNLLETLNDITCNLDNRLDTFIAYIDFAKAFDSVSVPKLFYKLSSLGIGGKLLCCIRSFLTGRQQRVKVGNAF